MITAVNEVLKGRPLNVVPRDFKIDRMTFKRCSHKNKFNSNEFLKPNYNNKHFFYYLRQK